MINAQDENPIYLLDTQAVITLYNKGKLEELDGNYILPNEVLNELIHQQYDHRHSDDGKLLVPGRLMEKLWGLIGNDRITLVNVGITNTDIKSLEGALRDCSYKKNSRVGLGDAALLKLAYTLSKQQNNVKIISSDSDIEEILNGYQTIGVDVIPSEIYIQRELKAY